MKYVIELISLSVTSSVARKGRGGLEPPHWLVKYSKSHVFNVLRPIFCEKLKIASPTGKQPPLKRLNFRIWPKNQTQFRRRPFFFFFFGDHLFLGGKNLRISELSEKFRLNFRTNRVKLIQEQSKFGSRSFALFSLFQNSPPFSKSWLRACQ